MNKIFKISLVFFAIIFLANTIVFASDVDTNLPNDNVDDDQTVYGSDYDAVNEAQTPEPQNADQDLYAGNPNTSSSTTAPINVGSTASLSSSSLSLPTIVNIILIVIGILLILLGIAILIRMH